MVFATVEDQWRPSRALVLLDLADIDHVVSCVMACDGPALERGNSTLQDRDSRNTLYYLRSRELVLGGRRELP